MSDLETRIMEQLKKATREQKLQMLEWLNEVVGPANNAPTIFKQKEDKGVFNITELADDGFSSDTDGDGVEDDKNTEDIDDDEIEESIEEEDDTDFDIEDDEEESDEIDDDEIDDIDLEDDEEPVKKAKQVKAKKKVDDEDFETEEDDDESEYEDPDDDTTDDIDDDDEEPVKKKGKQVKAKKVKFDEDEYDTWTADNIKQVKAYIKKTWGVNPNQFKGKDEKVASQLIDIDDDILTQQEKWEKMKLNKLEALCKKEGIKIKGRTEKSKKDNAVQQLTANYIEENY